MDTPCCPSRPTLLRPARPRTRFRCQGCSNGQRARHSLHRRRRIVQNVNAPPRTRARLACATMRGETDSTNWIDGPHNRWGFLHVRELTRTARIGGAPTGLAPPARGDDDIRSFTFDHLGRRWRFDEMLQATFTDGVMVVVDDVVIFEHYSGCMQPSDTHLLMSVSKSLTSTLAGVLAGQGLIDLTAFVPDYIGQLRGTAW